MKKYKECLKEAVGELNLVVTEFEADGMSYMDSAVSLTQVYDLIDQLDELEKVVIPQFVAEWYEENKKDLEYAIYEISNYVSARDSVKLNEMEVWFDDNSNNPTETLIKMKLFGYDIEKEKLYRVNMHGTTDVALLTLEGDEYYFDEPLDYVGERPDIRQEFTESEIKAIDWRYLAFKVPVEACEYDK